MSKHSIRELSKQTDQLLASYEAFSKQLRQSISLYRDTITQLKGDLQEVLIPFEQNTSSTLLKFVEQVQRSESPTLAQTDFLYPYAKKLLTAWKAQIETEHAITQHTPDLSAKQEFVKDKKAQLNELTAIRQEKIEALSRQWDRDVASMPVSIPESMRALFDLGFTTAAHSSMSSTDFMRKKTQVVSRAHDALSSLLREKPSFVASFFQTERAKVYAAVASLFPTRYKDVSTLVSSYADAAEHLHTQQELIRTRKQQIERLETDIKASVAFSHHKMSLSQMSIQAATRARYDLEGDRALLEATVSGHLRDSISDLFERTDTLHRLIQIAQKKSLDIQTQKERLTRQRTKLARASSSDRVEVDLAAIEQATLTLHQMTRAWEAESIRFAHLLRNPVARPTPPAQQPLYTPSHSSSFPSSSFSSNLNTSNHSTTSSSSGSDLLLLWLLMNSSQPAVANDMLGTPHQSPFLDTLDLNPAGAQTSPISDVAMPTLDFSTIEHQIAAIDTTIEHTTSQFSSCGSSPSSPSSSCSSSSSSCGSSCGGGGD